MSEPASLRAAAGILDPLSAAKRVTRTERDPEILDLACELVTILARRPAGDR